MIKRPRCLLIQEMTDNSAWLHTITDNSNDTWKYEVGRFNLKKGLERFRSSKILTERKKFKSQEKATIH
ncbi:unnamed protein product [Haemonchus placei]|uniref:Uncharacterized protein n=1 Tax=Haemonchus placei TaxID=6290 RepID=A0A3P7T1N3_HAEPC|nr:unnamed protein product [Haemonchus placei]